MSTCGQELGDICETSGECCPSQDDNDPVPQQLKEVLNLINLVNRKLEDCAVGWQAKISQKQWRILDTKTLPNESWERSILARTYFADKSLDNAFQGLLTYDKTFTDHLNNFIALLRGETSTAVIAKRTCDAQNQCSDPTNLEKPTDSSNEPAALESLEPSKLVDQAAVRSVHRTKTIVDVLLGRVRNSFDDLVKAKIHFDAKFLGVETVLNRATAMSSSPSSYLCQICSNGLVTDVGKVKKIKNFTATERPRRRRRVGKRLRRTRTLANGERQNRFASLANIGNNQSFVSKNNTCETSVVP